MSFQNLKRNKDLISKLVNEAEKVGGGEKKNYGDDRVWKPTVDKAGNGYAEFRFLPAPEGEDLPWVRYWDHGFKGPTGQWYIVKSLTSIGKDDPVGELNSRLWNSGHDEDKQTARTQKRRLHYVSNIYIVSDPGNPERDFGMGVVHGSYQSISNFDKFMEDIVGIFKDFERVNGQPFDLKGAVAAEKIRKKAVSAWEKIEPKIEKQYDIAKENSRKAHREISIRMPYLRSAEKRVYYKTDEPRELRHPDEYGDGADAALSSKEYTKYENAQAKISDIIEAFCKKHGYEFVWAASW